MSIDIEPSTLLSRQPPRETRSETTSGEEFQALCVKERALREVLENWPGMVVACDRKGHVRFVNSRVIDFLGEDPSARSEVEWSDYVHVDDSAILLGAWNLHVRVPLEMAVSYRLRRADGVYRWVDCRTQPVFNEKHEMMLWYGRITDIDDRRDLGENQEEPWERIGKMLDAIPGMHFVKSPDGMPQLMNQRLAEYLGVTIARQRRRGFVDLVHPDHAQMVVDAWDHSLRTGEPMSLEYLSIYSGGPWRWIHTHIEAFRHADGSVRCWFGSVVDVDDRKRAEEAMRNSEYMLRKITETIPALIFRFTPGGKIDYVNNQLAEYTGGTPSSLDLRDWINFLHPEDQETTWQSLTNCLLNGQSYAFSYRLRDTQGKFRWFEVRAEPLRNSAGEIEHWYGVHVDIEDRRQLQNALLHAQSRLAKAAQVATVGEMAASIAHEIKQPLAAIAANGDAGRKWLLSNPPNLERLSLCLERIIRDTDGLAQVVNRIRALFKESVPRKAPLNVDDLVEDALELLRHELNRREVIVERDLDGQSNSTLADKIQIQQVMINLIQNSLDAMTGNVTGAKCVLIRSRRKGGEIVVEVCDNGPGFGDSQRIFEAFFTTKEEGMGMGLAICKSIIEAHGGRIWARKCEPTGAVFAFSLPILGCTVL